MDIAASKKRSWGNHASLGPNNGDDDVVEIGNDEPPTHRSRSQRRTRPAQQPQQQQQLLLPKQPKLRPLEAIYEAHVQSELQDLQAALERERSLRALDQRRAQQVQSHLERQVQCAMEEAKDAKALLEEVREESEAHVDQLREAKADALLQLRDCQAQLLRVAHTSYHDEDDEEDEDKDTAQHYSPHSRRLAEEKQRLLEEKLQATTEEVDALRHRLQELTQQQMSEITAKSLSSSLLDPAALVEGQASPAPKEVLRELNRVRIALAESERKFRQLRRKAEEWQQKANQYVQQREATRSATARVLVMEQEVRELRKDYETKRALQKSWEDFGHELVQLIQDADPDKEDVESSLTTLGTKGPPEIATILRYLKTSKMRLNQLTEDKSALQRQLDATKEQLSVLEQQAKEHVHVASQGAKEKKDLQVQLEKAQRQVQTMKAQEGIWRREADSLRLLLQTYNDTLPDGTAPKSLSSSSQSSSNAVLELSLSTAREQIQVLTEERDRLATQVESIHVQQKEQEKEHERVLEKFGKLREALLVERTKAEQAEDRACQAETLAGKGAFHPDESRILHLTQNPLTLAIRERYESEIRLLQRQLEQITKGKGIPSSGTTGATSAITTASEVDPQKLHQRLKESFKEQIALFREGVYLMTGYKVDMLPGVERPTFRVRSVYAEQEQDHLMFLWPKGEDVTSLDLVETDLAKLLSMTDSYDYMTKFNSLPAFLASVQLSLFEKQTFIGN